MGSVSSSSSQFLEATFLFFVFVFFFFPNGVSPATIAVVNDCGFTVWPGIRSNPASNITGFELTNGNSRSFQTPASWNGRLWGRTGCIFNGSGRGQCASGNCESWELECNETAYTLPVTRAEFNIDQDQDLYGVSLTDGYNLQMIVEATGGSGSGLLSCAKTGCVDDLSQRCPMDLWVDGGGCQKAGCHAIQRHTLSCLNRHAQDPIAPRTMDKPGYLCVRVLITLSGFVPWPMHFQQSNSAANSTPPTSLFPSVGISRWGSSTKITVI